MRLFLVAVCLAFGCNPAPDSPNASITVFAAASLTDALHEVVGRFELQQPAITVHTHIGPTSLLARQIQQGAPADIFMAASPDWINYLQQRNLTIGSEITFARNKLVVLGSLTTSPITNLSELSTARRLAVADPSHVPAGVYGKQALQCAGVWDTIESMVIPTLDVRAALTAVVSGAADVAMVYGSDAALAPGLNVLFQVPDSCTPEINYVISTIRKTNHPEAAAAFVAFVTDSLQLDVWERFGFDS
ncbi:MAG: molybdate ABC transporter substrate-binding protein [Rhodothermaceae bacterium]|nr:molybdate ABC transporter substrate-binding protein [Rhodothermaceae bacterium]MXZ17446.1 molybdate ABC transporter substrate-binding protein [Rhodothermaceae bacterium]MYE62897.1 molybdate ABC transporter substrate-binding protein [Rhodothermaceae bacterium]MYG70749.1 molybdate ABC transporter substrate-binding protein [Rhodothermaceae bacterium]MYJ19446.1 molybdate ABC transporter substrate-binding protein [Rhodothermaceae bacterium]